MATLISYGAEMIRISPKDQNRIEYSRNGGSTWLSRYSGSSCGTFKDLLAYGSEIIAVTTKGVYYSKNGGNSWLSRYGGSSYGDFISLADGGNVLLATTSKGLYYSKNGGYSWLKK